MSYHFLHRLPEHEVQKVQNPTTTIGETSVLFAGIKAHLLLITLKIMHADADDKNGVLLA